MFTSLILQKQDSLCKTQEHIFLFFFIRWDYKAKWKQKILPTCYSLRAENISSYWVDSKVHLKKTQRKLIFIPSFPLHFHVHRPKDQIGETFLSEKNQKVLRRKCGVLYIWRTNRNEVSRGDTISLISEEKSSWSQLQYLWLNWQVLLRIHDMSDTMLGAVGK